ncbi:hypothetical protein SCHPADRAFT_948022, partial [Schizopora paradoxa]
MLPGPANTALPPMEVDDSVANSEGDGLLLDSPPPPPPPPFDLSGDFGGDYIQDDTLHQLGFAVHKEFRFAVCVNCGTCAQPKELRAHARGHNLPIDLPGVASCLEAAVLHRVRSSQEIATPPFFRAPLAILRPPALGFYCNLCVDEEGKATNCFGSETSYNDHFRASHPEHARLNIQFRVDCPTQYLFNFRELKHHFIVDPSLAIPPPEKSPAERFRERLEASRKPIDRVISVPLDVRVLNAFLYQTRWVNVTEGCDTHELAALVAVPKETEFMADLAQSVANYFKNIAENVTTSFSVINLRQIKAKDDRLTSHWFMNPQEERTTVTYIDEAVKLVLFVIRKRLNYCPQFPVVFNEEQGAAADAIINSRRTNSLVTTTQIHTLIYALLTQEVVDVKDVRFNHPVERFLIAAGRDPSGVGWKKLHEFSSDLARLEWCARTVIIYDAELHAHEYPNGRNGAVIDRVVYLRADRHFPFNLICETKAILSRVIEGSPKPPIVCLTRNRLGCTVYGNPVSLVKLRKGVPEILEKIEKKLRDDLLCGFEFTELETYIDAALDDNNPDVTLIDNLREETPGYCFYEDEGNHFGKFRRALFDKLMHPDHNTITGEGPLYSDTGKPVFLSQVQATKYFTRVDDFLMVRIFPFSTFSKMAYSLVKLVSGGVQVMTGGPFRTTEIAFATLTCNEHGARMLCYINGRLVLLGRYLKPRSIKGSDDLLPKGLPKRLSKVLILYVVLVLPVLDMLMESRFGADCLVQRKLYRDHLFVKSGKLYSSDNVTNALAHVTSNYCGGAISVNNLRHVVKVILMDIIGADNRLVDSATADPDEDDAVHNSFGHTSATGEAQYAILAGTAPTSNLSHFYKLIEVSLLLHDYYGIGDPKVTVEPSGQIVCKPDPNSILSSLVSGIVAGVKKEMEGFSVSTLIPALRD